MTQQNLTKSPDFRPNTHMLKYIEAAIDILSYSPTEVARHCITLGDDRTEETIRNQWYRWMEMPGFWDWFLAEWIKGRGRIIPELDRIGMQHAKRGSYQHWEAMNLKVGDLPTGKGTQVAVQINVVLPGELQEKHDPTTQSTE